MVDKVFNVLGLLVIVTGITALTRPGSQGPKLFQVNWQGFTAAQSAALGGTNYSGKK
jgi:hypothetical protein